MKEDPRNVSPNPDIRPVLDIRQVEYGKVKLKIDEALRKKGILRTHLAFIAGLTGTQVKITVKISLVV